MEMFVVRVWRAADRESVGADDRTALLQGLAEHVGTGATARFGGGEELLQFLRRTPTPSLPGKTELAAARDRRLRPTNERGES